MLLREDENLQSSAVVLHYERDLKGISDNSVLSLVTPDEDTQNLSWCVAKGFGDKSHQIVSLPSLLKSAEGMQNPAFMMCC